MSVHMQGLRDYTMLLGSVVLHLEEYQIAGGCVLREQGTAAGDAAVTAAYPKGTRLTLRGRLSPETDTAAAGASLDMVVRSGVTRGIQLGGLIVPEAKLIGYLLAEKKEAPEIAMVFYTQKPLEREETA